MTLNVDSLLIILSLLPLGFLAFKFVHSLFSSVYSSHSRVHAVRKILFNLIDNPEYIVSLNFEFNEKNGIPLFIEDIRNSKECWEPTQPYRENCHPVKIILALWIGKCCKMKKLPNLNKQEAVIYSLGLLINIFPIFYFWLSH